MKRTFLALCLSTLPIFTHTITPAPAVINAFSAELYHYLETEPTPHESATPTAMEKLFGDIFQYATLPYTQDIRCIDPQALPELHEYIKKMAEHHHIPTPLIFLSTNTQPQHIDIKLCTYQENSAILLHPGTFAALSTRVFERYVEQAIVRIQTTIALLRDAKHTHAIKNYVFLGTGIALPVIFGIAGWFDSTGSSKTARWATGGTALIAAALYTFLLCQHLKTKYACLTFQRISSFHNNEQAREDTYPAAVSPGAKNVLTKNPDLLYTIDMTLKIQQYLKARNSDFLKLEQEPYLVREKKSLAEEVGPIDTWEQEEDAEAELVVTPPTQNPGRRSPK